MNYLKINRNDIANGYGVRVSIFVTGCERYCEGCFNPETWDFSAGKHFGEEEMKSLLSDLQPKYIQGLTILGGEPLHDRNVKSVKNICKKVRNRFEYEKDIWIYTGFVYEEVKERCEDLLKLIDVLVDGEFQLSKKDLLLEFRGSENQRLVNVPESLFSNKINLL